MEKYINNATLGSTTYCGTWDEFRDILSDNMRVWFQELESMTYENFQNDALTRGLELATDSDIAQYESL